MSLALERNARALSRKTSAEPAPSKRSNLNIAVAHALGGEIVAGALPVGSLIPNEADLCTRFAVSRTVVREAVKLLTAKGLLRSNAGIGTWVLPSSEWNFLDPVVFSWVKAGGNVENLIQNLFEFRNAVEPAAAAEAEYLDGAWSRSLPDLTLLYETNALTR